MPVYEYRCERGHLFDVTQRMSDDPVTSCTVCEASVQRVFRPPAVHFKGSGFYTTDYGRAGSSNNSDKSASEGEGSKESSSGEGSKGEGSKGDGKTGSGGADAGAGKPKEATSASAGAASG